MVAKRYLAVEMDAIYDKRIQWLSILPSMELVVALCGTVTYLPGALPDHRRDDVRSS